MFFNKIFIFSDFFVNIKDHFVIILYHLHLFFNYERTELNRDFLFVINPLKCSLIIILNISERKYK